MGSIPSSTSRWRTTSAWSSRWRSSTRNGIAELITDPRVMVGLSDGGAHVDMLCDAGYCTYLLGKWVREKQAMTLEQAVKRITSEPADFFGIKDRGRLLPGMAADVACSITTRSARPSAPRCATICPAAAGGW